MPVACLSEYLENIKVVDAGIKATVSLIEDFYQEDGKTAYVFSADHGMTNWGKAIDVKVMVG